VARPLLWVASPPSEESTVDPAEVGGHDVDLVLENLGDLLGDERPLRDWSSGVVVGAYLDHESDGVAMLGGEGALVVAAGLRIPVSGSFEGTDGGGYTVGRRDGGTAWAMQLFDLDAEQIARFRHEVGRLEFTLRFRLYREEIAYTIPLGTGVSSDGQVRVEEIGYERPRRIRLGWRQLRNRLLERSSRSAERLEILAPHGDASVRLHLRSGGSDTEYIGVVARPQTGWTHHEETYGLDGVGLDEAWLEEGTLVGKTSRPTPILEKTIIIENFRLDDWLP
jgi:hypothetical protein